jgi:membrane protein required for colicin V production
MNSLDYSIFVVLIYFFISGIYNGLIQSLFSLLSILAGLFIAYIYGDSVSAYLIQNDNIPQDCGFLVPIVFFGITIIIIQLLGKFLNSSAKKVALGALNRMLGGVFGVIKASCIILFLVFVYVSLVELTNYEQPVIARNSLLLPKLITLLNSFFN